MTVLRFQFNSDRTQISLLRRAFFASWGRIPEKSRISIDGNILTVSTDCVGSGTLHVPRFHKQLSLVVHSTDTLKGREKPYLLLKELARGGLGRILRRLTEWQLCGFHLIPRLQESIGEAIRDMSVFATQDENAPETDRLADKLLNVIDEITSLLTQQYADQSLASRQWVTPRFPVPLGLTMHGHPAVHCVEEFAPYADIFHGVFSIINSTPSWREIEPQPGIFQWEILDNQVRVLKQNKFQIALGPLVRFDRDYLPNWILDTLDEGGDITDRASVYARAFAERYGEKIDFWSIVGHFASPSLPRNSVHLWVKIANVMAQTLRLSGITKIIALNIEQPWGDSHLWADPSANVFSLSHTLASCSLFDGIMIDINIGLSNKATLPRDLLTLSTLIDNWSYLGKKLFIGLSIPSEMGADPKKEDEYINLSFDWSLKTQQEMLQRYVQMMLTKRSVCGIFWNQIQDMETEDGDSLKTNMLFEEFDSTYILHGSDSIPLHFSHAGLLDVKGKIKPALKKLAAIRQIYLE